MTEVKVGQVWEDCDKRMAGRRIVVQRIEGRYAVCRRQGWLSRSGMTRIRLDRFKPTSTGFRLVNG